MRPRERRTARGQIWSVMQTSFLARMALGLSLLASSPALADIRYIGTGFTPPAIEPYGQAFAANDPVSIAYASPQPPRFVWHVVFSDPRIHVISWRGSGDMNELETTMEFSVGFDGSLGICDVAYLPIRADDGLYSASSLARREVLTTAAVPEVPTFVMAALGAALMALATGGHRAVSGWLRRGSARFAQFAAGVRPPIAAS
jgi:hypothetical protein